MTNPASRTAPAGRTAIRTELLVPGPADALAALLDIPPPYLDRLAPSWHCVYLLERPPSAELNADGHHARGIPSPPSPDAVRMFAGGRVSEHAPLRLGFEATRTTRVVSSTRKHGRSGPMTLVTVRHDIAQDGRVAIVEEQEIVYRAPGPPPAPPFNAGAAPVTSECLQLPVDNVLLFRFSALTYNGHRIHYDQSFAAGEGYPGLVVHGPLQALLLRELFRRAGAPDTGHQFTYRLVSPAFGNPLLTVRPMPTDDGWSARVEDPTGRITAWGTLRRP